MNSPNHDKTQKGMVAWSITYLATNTSPVVVEANAFLLISLERYQLALTSPNRYLLSKGNFNLITKSGNLLSDMDKNAQVFIIYIKRV